MKAKFENIEQWHRYIGIDEDGTAFFFHKKPEYIKGYYVPSEFRKEVTKSAEKVGKKYPKLAGKILKRTKKQGEETKWKVMN